MVKQSVRWFLAAVLMMSMTVFTTAFKYTDTVRSSTSQAIKAEAKAISYLNISDKKTSKKSVQLEEASQTSATFQTQAQNQSPAKQSLLRAERVFTQLLPPAKGDQIAVIKTNVGTIRIKLLTAYAPKTVAFFIDRVSNGFYNGTDFFRIVPNLSIQGGQQSQSNPISTGQLDNFSSEARNFRGAVSLVYSDAGQPQDQFSIVQADADNIKKDQIDFMNSSGDSLFPKYVIDKYRKIGGAPFSDFHNVVFGQVLSGKQGLDVVDSISQQDIDESNHPKREIKILKVNIIVN